MTQSRTPHEAVARYLDELQLLVSCVTRSVVVADTYQVPHYATINNGDPVLLQGPSRFQLALRQYFVPDSSDPGASWHVVVSSYSYKIHDFNGREVLLYHWHPRGNSSVATPHLHLEQGAQVGRTEVRDAHLPTGDVSLNAVLRVLIEEMGVQSRRPDWDSILSG